MILHRKKPVLRSLIRSESGASAAEFTLVLIPLIMLTLGTINIGMMIFTASTLHFAVEDAARCASVRTATTCSTAQKIRDYAASVYKGPGGVTVTFTPSSAACGNVVTGTANYVFSTGITSSTIPLSMTACYPLA